MIHLTSCRDTGEIFNVGDKWRLRKETRGKKVASLLHLGAPCDKNLWPSWRLLILGITGSVQIMFACRTMLLNKRYLSTKDHCLPLEEKCRIWVGNRSIGRRGLDHEIFQHPFLLKVAVSAYFIHKCVIFAQKMDCHTCDELVDAPIFKGGPFLSTEDFTKPFPGNLLSIT